MRRAGIKALPSVINAAVFTSALSAANTCLFCASRILYGLSIRGQAPKYLSKCTSSGLPIYAILTTSLFVPLSFLSVSSGSSKVFTWLTNLTTVSG
jgi:yeast amino acid transporter